MILEDLSVTKNIVSIRISDSDIKNVVDIFTMLYKFTKELIGENKFEFYGKNVTGNVMTCVFAFLKQADLLSFMENVESHMVLWKLSKE